MTIRLDGYCGNNGTYEIFWDASLSWNTTTPDISRCMQQAAITPGVCALFWFSALLYLPWLRAQESINTLRNLSKVAAARAIFSGSLVLLMLINLVYYLSNIGHGPTTSIITETVILLATYIFVMVINLFAFMKGEHSVSIIVSFWILKFLTGTITFRSYILQYQNNEINGYLKFTFVSFYVEFSLVACNIITSVIVDVSSMGTGREKYSDEKSPLLHAGSVKDTSNLEMVKYSKPCPQLTASVFSRLLFAWFTRTMITGYRRPLTFDDIWDIRDDDSCKKLVPSFHNCWDSELRKCDYRKRKIYTESDYSKEQSYKMQNGYGSLRVDSRERDNIRSGREEREPSLFMALLKYKGYGYFLPGIFMFFYNIIVLLNPLILSAMISFIEGADPYVWRGYIYAVGMFVCSVSSILCMHHQIHFMSTAGMRIRTGLCAAIYRKSLRLSCTARKESSVGEIVNLMSVDTQKVQDSAPYLHYLWGAPMAVVLATILLWQVLGPSCLTGVIFLLLALPLNSVYFASKIREYQREQMILKDQRVKLVNQILNGMKVIKLYAWEENFSKRILQIRSKELVYLRKAAVLGAITYVLWNVMSVIVALLCFITFILVSEDNVLDAQTAFVTISIVQSITFTLIILPTAIRFTSESVVSMKRIQKFLLMEERDPGNVEHTKTSSGNAIEVIDGNFHWGEYERATLQNITLRIPSGGLVAVVGTVGSGKSSLISALLGDMIKIKGSVTINGTQAYVPQQAWIQNMSLQNNILFKNELIKKKYDTILDACALLPDLRILPGGDQTEIGEKGINLSGGQKQRVSLARAVYQDSDIYLLDDPLSAVDAHVGKHIFERVIGPNGLLEGKTRILVTHGVSYLPKMDMIIVLKEGKIAEVGNYEELSQKNGGFSEFLKNFANTSAEASEDEETDMTNQNKSEGSRSNQSYRSKRKRTVASKSVESDKKKININLTEEESADSGPLKFDVLRTYILAASSKIALLVVAFLFLTIASQVGTNIWLSEWTNDEIVNGTQDTTLRNIRLGVYAALGGAQAISSLGLAICVALGGIKATEILHYDLLANILRCPMSFFDRTPLGRIINRFAKDVDICDVNIPQFFRTFISSLAPIFATLIIISYTIPVLVALFIPLMFLFAGIQRVYIRSASQIKRMDSTKRSPMYAFFSETLTGYSSIRAYKQEQRFMRESDHLLDTSNRVWFPVYTSNRWIGIFAEVINDIIILSTAILCVSQRDSLNAGLVGLALSFALQLGMSIIMTVRSSCELETYIVAVERIKEYIDESNERDWILPKSRPPANWPTEGSVSFKEYSTRYRPGLDFVLRNFTCHIKHKEKIGVVGRTGAGKSSLTLALFRIIEPVEGTIIIDGVDLKSLGLHDVRNKLTIIPQDPVLFSGSIRFNIDPSGTYSDTDVWDALRNAHLYNFVSGLPGCLDYECGEDGDNFSVGQRQLLCLARALLKKSKILILDEATAAVDMETDELIQKTIRVSFNEYTVITIAHRINTIMDYDRILVLDNGSILEYDSPDVLKNKEGGAFLSMMKSAGLSC